MMLRSRCVTILLVLTVAIVTGQEVPQKPSPAGSPDSVPQVTEPVLPELISGSGGDEVPPLPPQGPLVPVLDTASGADGSSSGLPAPPVESPLTPPVAIPDDSASSRSPPAPVDSGDLPPQEGVEEKEAEPEMREDEGSYSVTTDACSDAMTNICKLGDSYTFEESLRCLESHVNELQGACSVALNVMMSNMYTDCGGAVSSLCENSASGSGGDESVYVLSCLSNHESELSVDCQQQLDTYLKEEYPCTKEANLFCSQSSYSQQTPEHTLSCLETIAHASPEEISSQCMTVLDGFSSCKDVPDDGSGRDDNRGKPEPKPKPRAGARLLIAATDNELSSEMTVSVRDDKPKPKPKPKSGSGGARKCWQGRESRNGDSFLNNLGELGGYGTTTDSHDDESHSTGLVMSSLVVVLALVGVVGVKYRQSQEEVDSKGGYWRAPSIQAMLYDDSVHAYGDGSGDAGECSIQVCKAVEMDEFQTAISVNVSPIPHADEIRV